MLSKTRGFSLIEVLVTAFVLSTVTIALTGLSLVSTRSAIESERQNVAQALANEKVESLIAIANSQEGYSKVDYADRGGVIPRTESVDRNGLPYTVEAFVNYVDDPRNGTLPPGTILTKTNADFTKVLYKVSWPSNVSGSGNPASSSTIVAATIFSDKVNDSCIPGTITCENPTPDCVAGAPAGCADSDGNFTLDCPASGVCPSSDTKPFVACPESGKCADVGKPTPAPTPPNQSPTPTPEWCQEFSLNISPVEEQCVLDTPCSDGINNDSDQGIDTTGFGAAAPDPECKEAAANQTDGLDSDGDGQVDELDERALFRASPCTCSGLQEVERIGPYDATGQCSATRSCEVVEKSFRACEPPASCPGPEEDRCQETKGCPKFTTCTNPIGFFPQGTCTTGNCCPDNIPKCSQDGGCFECVVNTDNTPGVPIVDACDTVVTLDPERGQDWCQKGGGQQCQCRSGKCVQCTKFGEKDPDSCKDLVNKPYCSFSGACVECTSDLQCAGQTNGKKPYCRTVKYPLDNRNVCVDQCHNGRDDDNDGLIDAEGLDRNGDGVIDVGADIKCGTNDSEAWQCSDGKDNDQDGKADWNGAVINGIFFPQDPGCSGATDPNEKDEQPIPGIPGPQPQCNDEIDNDGDGKADFNGTPNFPSDPGCQNTSDNDESDAAPLPVQAAICSDKIDNDGDGKIDFPADPGCADANDIDEFNPPPIPPNP